MDLNNKVALITGAASGIGLAIVEELLSADVKGIVMVDVESSKGEEVYEELNSKYGNNRIVFVHADVCNEQQLEEAFKTAISKFGQLDIVINNAGIAADIEYEKTIAVNLTSVVRGTLLGFKYLTKNKSEKGGVILSTASVTAVEDEHAVPVYSATKGGVVNLMRGFGHRFYYEENNIRTLAILPGYTCTNIGKNTSVIGGHEKFVRVITDRKSQTASAVARGAIHVIKNGESGSTWIIDDSKLYLLPAPEYGSYGTLVKDNLKDE